MRLQDEIASRHQIILVAICFLITIIDGFDLLSISVVAPVLSREWGLDPIELGVVFSSGLIGMGLGALLLSPIGDFYGRKKAILLNLFLVSLGMTGSSLANDIYQLAAMRLVAGLGIGAMISNTTALIMEFVPTHRRTLALGLMMVGNPIGNLSSGVVALFVLETAGWQALFLTGALATATLIPIVMLTITESIEFLTEKRPRNALERINKARLSLKLSLLTSLPDVVKEVKPPMELRSLLQGELLQRTLLIGTIQFIFMFAYYIYVNWSPKIVADMGASDQAAVLVSMSIFAGGISGPLLVPLIVRKLGSVKTTTLGFFTMSLGIFAFGLIPSWLALIGTICLITGFIIYATQIPLLALIAESFPTEVRTSALGLSFAIGRVGSVIGPIIAGFLLDNGAARAGLFMVAAFPLLVGAFLIKRVAK